jgi:hypothetical protein
MKHLFNLCVLAFLVCAAGCNKAENGVDTSGLEKSFSTAEPQQKSSVDKVVSSIRTNNYSGALSELRQLTTNAKLTPEQRQSIENTVKQLQNEATETAKKVAEDAREGLNKALKK